ncbi:type IV pilin protein [Ideonella sp. A 288]|uniref:type IV pilin protein n=1 Tax=Ideonella sp. A 288 TaxID=1962181 RepID=UPI000B4AC4FB|nr:type IV pilin protein [Ideonella sp. A 288]
MRARHLRGFTLIELMIGVAILAILVSLAYPSYVAQVAKGRRTDGKSALLDVAQRMERFYTERGTYVGATLGAAGIHAATSSQDHYNLAITAQSAAAFTITATPKGAQAGDACGTYSYTQAGVKAVGGGATLSAAVCW